MEEVNIPLFNRRYKRRSKMERAWDKALEEINDKVYKLLAEVPMKGFDEDGLRQVRFNLEISLKGNVFSHSLKYEVV